MACNPYRVFNCSADLYRLQSRSLLGQRAQGRKRRTSALTGQRANGRQPEARPWPETNHGKQKETRLETDTITEMTGDKTGDNRKQGQRRTPPVIRSEMDWRQTKRNKGKQGWRRIPDNISDMTGDN